MRLLSLLFFLMVPLTGAKMTGSLDAPVATLHGIDISHYQANIDWATLTQKQDLHFAFVKATEGVDFHDSLFCFNWEQMKNYGVRRGAYHYFRPGACGFEQALNFLETVELSPGDLAPVLDLETTDGVPTHIMLEEARIWLQTIERSFNIRPILYTNQNFYDKYLLGVFDNYPLWIARYSEKMPELGNNNRWKFWQYSDQATMSGVNRKVDLNVFWGTPSMLDHYCWFPSEGLSMPIDPNVAP